MSAHRARRPHTHDRRPAWAGAALLAGTLAAGAVTGCGNPVDSAGPATTQQRTVDGAHAVTLLTSGDLTLLVGPAPRLTVTAARNTLRALTSTVHRGTLVLGSKPGHNSGGGIHYVLTLPRIDALVSAGSGDTHGPVATTGPFALTATGSGGIRLTGLDAAQVTVALRGSGNTTLSGDTAAQRVTVSGSGSYDGQRLTTRDTSIEIGGSGDAQIAVARRLSAHLAGSGTVTYTGAPTTVRKNVSGSGDLSAS